jgi:hypothetical protein
MEDVRNPKQQQQNSLIRAPIQARSREIDFPISYQHNPHKDLAGKIIFNRKNLS